MNDKHLTLVPPAAPSFEEAGEAQCREACERLAAALILVRYAPTPEAKEALKAARSALVPFRLTRGDTEKIELRAATSVVRFFLGE